MAESKKKSAKKVPTKKVPTKKVPTKKVPAEEKYADSRAPLRVSSGGKGVAAQRTSTSQVPLTNRSNLQAPFSNPNSPSDAEEETRNRVAQYFLAAFVIALSFVIGTGVGSRTGESIVDGAITQIIDSAPQPIDRVLLERAAIEGALRASGDEWANYFPVTTLDKLAQLTTNSISGAGISITRTRSGAIQVADVQAGSPADRSGIRVGDQILRVNDKNVQGQRATSVAALIRGESGKRISIDVRRDSEILSFSLVAESVDVKTVEVAQIAPKVAYISISSFSSRTAFELSTSLESIQTESGIILDLRDNPGGSIEIAVRVAERFIGRGVIVSYRVNGEERVLSASNPKPITSPIVVLINRGTSSSAEILAAALQDRNRGVIIGENSYGKGSVQDFVTLKDGSKLELTVGLYLTPSGRTIEGIGVSPDLEVSDEELSTKALQILGGLTKLTMTENEVTTDN